MEGDLSARLIVVRGEDFAVTAASFLAEALRERGRSRPDAPVSLALSGGRTPGPVYDRLASVTEVPWERVVVYFVDERAVPPDDSRSNFGLVRRRLLDPLGVPPERVHRMEAERSDRAAAAAEYAAALPERLDVLVLGIGEDGHTASLFPGDPTLPGPEAGVEPATGDGAERTSVRAVEAPADREPRQRLTLTPDPIRRAREIVVLATGRRKAEAVRRALEERGSVREVPARLAGEGTWILDREAASRLRARR